jgi:hypothetical protein
MDCGEHGAHQVAQELCGDRLVDVRVQLGVSKFAGTVEGGEQALLIFFRLRFNA